MELVLLLELELDIYYLNDMIIICKLIEKLHRYVFDNIYVQDVVNKRWHQIPIILLNILSYIIPHWREELNREYPKGKYQRYKTY
jgi:hypothetical protein